MQLQPEREVSWLFILPTRWVSCSLLFCCWPCLSAVAYNPTSLTRRLNRSRSLRNTVRCGLCRRKCSSQTFHSSYPAPVFKSLTPKGHRLGRAVTSCRTPTEGTKVPLPVVFLGLREISPTVLPSRSTGKGSFSLNRYYGYMFGRGRKQRTNNDSSSWELTGLQVWITSADSECAGHPSLTSDESCELFLFLVEFCC